MTRKPWQEKAYEEIHGILQQILLQAMNGITKTELREKTRLSRPTIDKHLNDFIAKKKVEKWGRLFFWSTNYLVLLERYRLILEILEKQEKAEAVLKTKIAIAQDTLKGDSLNRRLDEIYMNELGWRAEIFGEQKERGISGAKEKEAMMKDLLREFERAPLEKRLEILKKHREILQKG